MEHTAEIQRALNAIDERITEKITLKELADTANYSVYYFCRIFQRLVGMPVSAYITRRKLQYALVEIARGRKIVDIAMEYGYETHAGFTRAFKRCFGCPPSVYCLHIGAMPQSINLKQKLMTGGNKMHPQIIRKEPLKIVGFLSRHALPHVKFTHDIPAFWNENGSDYSEILTRLHSTFTKSEHNEFSVCFDADLTKGEFRYFLGVGVDNPEDLERIESDMEEMELPGGLYALFTTPSVPEARYSSAIRDTWNTILFDWLPGSGYEFDESRPDFEYYDKRDHAWENNGMQQMDICIPIRGRGE